MTTTRRLPRKPPGPLLVTGGAGRIGARVVETLLAQGHEVRVLDDLSSGRASSLPLHDPNLDLRAGDVLDPEAVSAAMSGARACVHLAATPPRPGADPYPVTLSNILAFINVLEAARRHRLPRLVYASSAAVYGDAACPPAEKTPPRPCGPEGMEKLVAEGYAELYARRHGLSALGLRYVRVRGAGAPAPRAGVVPRVLERIEARRAAATPDLDVEDAAAATVAALASHCRGVCNVASAQPARLRDAARSRPGRGAAS